MVTPGPLLPAREVLADILLQAGSAADAQLAYEAVLAKEPNRYRAIAGARASTRLSASWRDLPVTDKIDSGAG